MSKIYFWLVKKLALNALTKWIKRLFGKKDYREVYKPISEASYLESRCEYKKPKYAKLKRFFVSIIIYTFMLSLAYNILLIREIAELKENLDFILMQAQELNDENKQMVDILAEPQVKQEFKRIEIQKEKGKYVEKYSIEPK